MKTILVGLLSLSFSAFAQIDDGYHVEPKIICTTGECIHQEGSHPIEMIKKYDMHGNEYKELNTDSSILDVLGPGVNKYTCFSGKKMQNLLDIIDGLVGNTNMYYTQGGHAYIKSHHGYTVADGFKVVLEVKSDYRPFDYVFSPEIKFCEEN